jgi:hypothetical protein
MSFFMRNLCAECQARAAGQIADEIPIEDDLGILDVFCPHERVGAEIMIHSGVIVDWSVRPFRDLAQFERFVAAQKGLRREAIRTALSLATAGGTQH